MGRKPPYRRGFRSILDWVRGLFAPDEAALPSDVTEHLIITGMRGSKLRSFQPELELERVIRHIRTAHNKNEFPLLSLHSRAILLQVIDANFLLQEQGYAMNPRHLAHIVDALYQADLFPDDFAYDDGNRVIHHYLLHNNAPRAWDVVTCYLLSDSGLSIEPGTCSERMMMLRATTGPHTHYLPIWADITDDMNLPHEALAANLLRSEAMIAAETTDILPRSETRSLRDENYDVGQYTGYPHPSDGWDEKHHGPLDRPAPEDLEESESAEIISLSEWRKTHH